MEEEHTRPDYSINQLVFYLLILLTIGEFMLGVIATSSIWTFMLAIGFLKAFFIVYHYMHVGKLWSSGEEDH